MKKRLTVLLLLMMLTGAMRLFAQEAWTDHARLLPDRLRDIPTGITVFHSPTPVWPELNTDTANYPGKYIWKHSTRMSSEAGELEVIAAGSYIWWKDKGWTPNIDLDRQDFAKYFNCPGGLLKTGRSYTFIKNYRHGDGLYAGDALWFVLAKDKKGKVYKGIALVETEGKLLPLQTAFKLKPNDLDGLLGRKWSGNLTYLDYGTNKMEPVSTELTVTAIGQTAGVYSWATVYPQEVSHNSTDTLRISKDGTMIDDETVKERALGPDGTLKIVTAKAGKDNNKTAAFRFTYLIGKTSFSRRKEVCYEGTTGWFTRNELNLKIK